MCILSSDSFWMSTSSGDGVASSPSVFYDGDEKNWLNASAFSLSCLLSLPFIKRDHHGWVLGIGIFCIHKEAFHYFLPSFSFQAFSTCYFLIQPVTVLLFGIDYLLVFKKPNVSSLMPSCPSFLCFVVGSLFSSEHLLDLLSYPGFAGAVRSDRLLGYMSVN